jgi:hypothetical protein
MQLFTSGEFLSLSREVRPSAAPALNLPLLNVKSSRLRTAISELYELRTFTPAPGISKDVARLKGGRGLRIKGIDYRGAVNNDSHPVRRCTDSVFCDVAARLRLGFSLPERFEFDVSCETGLAGKQFRMCDGAAMTIPDWADHLNMRINDDFECGRR